MASPAFSYSPQWLNLHHRINTKSQASHKFLPQHSSTGHSDYAPFSSQITSRSSNLSPLKASPESATIVGDSPVASSLGTSTDELLYSEEDEKAVGKIGARVRVKVPLKVYHIPKVSGVELNGREGVLKQYVTVWKDKRISASFPFKVGFVEKIEGRDGLVKFFAHLKEDEFEFVD